MKTKDKLQIAGLIALIVLMLVLTSQVHVVKN